MNPVKEQLERLCRRDVSRLQVFLTCAIFGVFFSMMFIDNFELGPLLIVPAFLFGSAPTLLVGRGITTEVERPTINAHRAFLASVALFGTLSTIFLCLSVTMLGALLLSLLFTCLLLGLSSNWLKRICQKRGHPQWGKRRHKDYR
jgi:hypothetical protein